jgi:hypothetical protein
LTLARNPIVVFRTLINAAFNQNQIIEEIKTCLVKQINTKI